MIDAQGSPLVARQNPYVYLVIVVLAILVSIIFLIFLLYKFIEKQHSTPEYIAKQKEKITSL